MIICTDHAEKRYCKWYLGVPGYYAVYNEFGKRTGEFVYSLP